MKGGIGYVAGVDDRHAYASKRNVGMAPARKK